jgi:hypothetical protein
MSAVQCYYMRLSCLPDYLLEDLLDVLAMLMSLLTLLPPPAIERLGVF